MHVRIYLDEFVGLLGLIMAFYVLFSGPFYIKYRRYSLSSKINDLVKKGSITAFLIILLCINLYNNIDSSFLLGSFLFISTSKNNVYFYKNNTVSKYSKVYLIIKRFTGNKIMQNFSNKLPYNQLLAEQQKISYNKMIFYQFCEHFKNLSLKELLDDRVFISYTQNAMTKYPTLHSRAFQLALEVTYSTRKFSEETLRKIYENNFIIQDTYNVNKGFCDQSTIYSANLTEILAGFLGIKKNDLVVHSTPIFLTKDKITAAIQTDMNYNKAMTGNTCADLSWKGRPYDYKDTKSISYNENHIYFIDMTEITIQCYKHLKALELSLNTNINNTKTSQNVLQYSQQVLKVILNGKSNNESVRETYEKILLFVKNTQPPKEFKIPLLIYIEKTSIHTLSKITQLVETSNIPLEGGSLTDVKARKAIMGIIDKWSNPLKFKVQESTSYAINYNIDSVD